MLPGVHFSEFLIICVVALVVIGPRDLPKLARTVAGYIRQARGLAKDFQRSFDEMGRALELEDLRREVDALKRGEPLKEVTSELKAFERDLKTIDQSTRAELDRPAAIAAPTLAPRPSAGQTPAIAEQAPKPEAPPSKPTLAEDAPREDRKLSEA